LILERATEARAAFAAEFEELAESEVVAEECEPCRLELAESEVVAEECESCRIILAESEVVAEECEQCHLVLLEPEELEQLKLQNEEWRIDAHRAKADAERGTELKMGEREKFVFEIPAPWPLLKWRTRGITFEKWTAPVKLRARENLAFERSASVELEVGELSVVDLAATAPILVLEGKTEFEETEIARQAPTLDETVENVVEVPHRQQEWIGQRECWRWVQSAQKGKQVFYRKTRWVKGKAAPTGEMWVDRSESRAIETSGELEVPEVNRDELVVRAERIQVDMDRLRKESEERALRAQQVMDQQRRENEARAKELGRELDQLRHVEAVRAEDVARLRAQLAMARRGRTLPSSLRLSQVEAVELHERGQRWWGW
jgi:hypothetical protein